MTEKDHEENRPRDRVPEEGWISGDYRSGSALTSDSATVRDPA
jgi:hypothetical protein